MRFTAIVIAVLAMCASSHAERKHLFILSGQSNMFHMKSRTFHAAVEKAFGKENVTVAKNAKRGAPIRAWDKDYTWPEDRRIPQGRKKPGKKEKTREEFIAGFGSLYDKLMAAVKKNTEGRTFDTVTFVWMQGESDSGEAGVPQYRESFERVVARLKADLKIKSMNIVIGRLSDYKETDGAGSWAKMRQIQMKMAEDNPNVEWVNTDDLNDKDKGDGKTENGLHYTKEGYDILGERFAEKAIALIQKKETR